MRYQMDVQDVQNFAATLGIPIRQKGNEIKFRICPHCKGERDKWTFSLNAVTGAYNCPRASCGQHGHFVELARDFGFTLRSIQQSRFKELPQMRLLTSTPAEKYLTNRKIRKEIVQLYGVTTAPNDNNVLIFPFYSQTKDADGHVYKRLEFVKYRRMNFDKKIHKAKEWCEADCKPILFGMDRCNPEKSKTLVVTEGQIDSLSLASAGIPNAVSVPNGARGFTWAEHCRSFMAQFKEIVVFGDCENGDITLVREMQELFPTMAIKCPRMQDYLGEKDANDILCSFGEDALKKAVECATVFQPPAIKDMADVQEVDLSQIPHIQTFFPALDMATTGLYEGNLITLTGKCGTGKSTFASMLAVAALHQEWNCLIYSGELLDYEVKRWLNFQLAGEDALRRKVTIGGETTYLDESQTKQLNDWYRNRLFIVDNDAVDDDGDTADLCEQVIAAVKCYGVRFAIIDNLMTAIEVGDDLYFQQARLAKKLKKIAKKYHIIVVLVAHPRKTKSGELSTDDVSGSGNVTNLSDLVISLDRKAEKKPDGEIINKTLLALQKNRITGELLQDDARVRLLYSKKSKRLYQAGSDGIAEFPFSLETAVKQEVKLSF